MQTLPSHSSDVNSCCRGTGNQCSHCSELGCVQLQTPPGRIPELGSHSATGKALTGDFEGTWEEAQTHPEQSHLHLWDHSSAVEVQFPFSHKESFLSAVKDHPSPPRHPQAAFILVGFLGSCFQGSTEVEMAHELQESGCCQGDFQSHSRISGLSEPLQCFQAFQRTLDSFSDSLPRATSKCLAPLPEEDEFN